MKTLSSRLLCAAASSLIASATLFAQSSSTLHVTIPFEFVAGGQHLQPGDYTIQETTDTGTVYLYNSASHQSAIVLTEPGTAPLDGAQPKLRFVRQGSDVHLVQLQAGDGSPARLIQFRR